MFFSTRLQSALRRGLAPGGRLDEELQSLGNYTVTAKKDALAVVAALKRFPDDLSWDASGFASPLYQLADFLQDADGPAAIEVFRTEGRRELCRIFDALLARDAEKFADDLLFILKVLAMYGSRAGAERVVRAARAPLKPDSYWWAPVLQQFVNGHPEQEYVFAALAEPLPPDFIAMSLLDAANQQAIEHSLAEHPFDTPGGVKQFEAWLTDSDPQHFSYAQSTAAALPFISNAAQSDLLMLAREHASPTVQIEGAWASAKVGHKIGIELLKHYCRDVNHSALAARYLAELGLEDEFPAEAQSPEFVAKSRFAEWLAHPNELGRSPDALEVIDTREQYWPPAGEVTAQWLIKYRVRDEWGLQSDDVGVGLVGPGVWCFFSYELRNRPCEDAYAIHCFWELDLEVSEVDDPAEYAELAARWPGPPLSGAMVTHVVELPPKLNYGRRIVAVMASELNGAAGWGVLDGAESRWYSAAEMAPTDGPRDVLKVHIGRKLLGYPPTTSRRRITEHDPPELAPEEFLKVYEDLLADCENASPVQQRRLLAEWSSPIVPNLGKYAEVCEQACGTSRADAYHYVLQKYFAALETLPAKDREEALGTLRHADDFQQALVTLIDSPHREWVAQLLTILEPVWDHNAGYAHLGDLAFRLKDYATAERLLLKFKNECDGWARGDEIATLAKIWLERGEVNAARQLMVDCLTELAEEAQSATGSDREEYEEWYQNQLTKFRELFPVDATNLAKLGVRETTLRKR